MNFKTACITVIIAFFFGNNLHAQKTATFKDKRDKKKYTTVKIGNQIFMAQNLAYKPSFGLFWNGFENEDSLQIYGYLYDWKTEQHAIKYSKSFAVNFMKKRSEPNSISYLIIPNMNIYEYIFKTETKK
ncbi:MAG TPA: FISUMP domain-containing protein [Bacteroidales bacterium]|nr:FISUMP domain-containing protein [Bacteroidales bacterium]